MKHIFIVYYYGGEYEEFEEKIVFATFDRDVAEKYIQKFNSILDKWKEYYSQFEDNGFHFSPYLKLEHEDKYDRWDKLNRITKCVYRKIQIR